MKVHKVLPGSSFNSLLLNRYKGGNDYVAWHSDDDKLYGSAPEIASVSFGCDREFLLKKKPGKKLDGIINYPSPFLDSLISFVRIINSKSWFSLTPDPLIENSPNPMPLICVIILFYLGCIKCYIDVVLYSIIHSIQYRLYHLCSSTEKIGRWLHRDTFIHFVSFFISSL